MWEQLDPKTANLQSIYELLLNKAEQYDHRWSIAELKLSPDDILWLKSWFADINPEVVSTILYDRFKSVGEAMAIGRTFKEALQKAIRSLEIERYSLDKKHTNGELTLGQLKKKLQTILLRICKLGR
jgi:carbamoylphosphate synthase large subunit